MSKFRVSYFRLPVAAVAACAVVGTSLVLQPTPAQALTPPTKIWDRAVGSGFQESSPVVANLDGQNDVIVGNLDGRLYGLKGDTGADVAGWPVDTKNGIDSTASTADIDGAGRPTVFIGTGTPAKRSGDLIAINANGSQRWSFHPSDNDFPELSMFSSPALGDVNKDGSADVSAFSLGLLGWSFSAGGAKNKGWPFYQDDTVFSSPALYDVDGDGTSEYIVGGDSTAGGPVDHRGGFMRAIKGDGSLLWSFPVDEMVRSSPVVGDMDGDGKPEIVFGTGDYWVQQPGGASDSTKLFALNTDGTLKWVKDLGGRTMAAPAMADFNGDGKLDVALGTWEGSNPGKVWAFDGAGNALNNYAGKDSGGGIVLGQISTADFNNDGAQDMLVPTGAGVFAYDGKTGSQLFSLNVGARTAYQNAPYVGDIDSDGRIDIVIAGAKTDGTGVVTRFEMPDTTARLGSLGWHQFRKDNRLTGAWPASNFSTNLCANSTTNEGYWMSASDGGVFSYCNAPFFGSMGGKTLASPIVNLASTPDHKGYWEVAGDGGIFAFGNAQFFGSTGGTKLASPVVGMARTPSGNGYWLVAGDGGIFAYGDARFYGSMGGRSLNKPIVGMSPTASGNGYWLVASDGGIFAFGDAKFYGSMGGQPLNKPIVGMTTTGSGNGYWFVASDGGIFAYGDAQFRGSAGSLKLNSPVVGMAANAAGNGYRLVAADGGIFAYNSSFLGSTGAIALNKPIIGISTAG